MLAVVLVAGCSRFDAPTASQPADNSTELWNPQPGDQVVPGRDVPIIEEGYWDAVYGPEVNPFMVPCRAIPIGPEGGTVVLGLHRLIVPPGALSERVLIKLANASVTSVGVDASPEGLTFALPVTLTLSFHGTQYEDCVDCGAEALQIFYMAPDGTLEAYESTVDLAAETVSAQLTHFSRYIIS